MKVKTNKSISKRFHLNAKGEPYFYTKVPIKDAFCMSDKIRSKNKKTFIKRTKIERMNIEKKGVKVKKMKKKILELLNKQ